jgi:hypothetical protein
MTITYSDAKKQEWENFKNKGGSITFEIDPEDISSTNRPMQNSEKPRQPGLSLFDFS